MCNCEEKNLCIDFIGKGRYLVSEKFDSKAVLRPVKGY
jgi:hypothetical protein